MKPYYADDLCRLYLGDCRELLPDLIADQSVDVIDTDPPYESLNIHIATGNNPRLAQPTNGKRLKTPGEKVWFNTIASDQLGELLTVWQAKLKPDGALYAFADVKSGLEFFPALHPANVLTWDKGSIGMGYNWRKQTEWIAYCPMQKHKLRDRGLSELQRVAGVENKVHPTEKPPAIHAPLILNSTDRGGLIVDPFCGAGSAIIMAKRLKRRGIGIDSVEQYLEIAAERLSQRNLGDDVPEPVADPMAQATLL